MECIILAGGLGTRLQSVIGEFPKCMAPVNGKPFLHYLFEYLQTQGCTRVVLSLGYKHEVILDWLKKEQPAIDTLYVVEEQPLGTGGGIRLALEKIEAEEAIILNGDTMFQVDLPALIDFHNEMQSETTIALKEMHEFERYGVVMTAPDGRVKFFEEKQYRKTGLINGGIYVVNRNSLLQRDLREKFSFEKDYLEANVTNARFYGKQFDGYFIDIGIPEDYSRAQEDLKKLFG